MSKTADLILQRAAGLWFLVAVLGQLIFTVYIVAFYSRGVIAGDLALWNQVLAAGYVPGNTMGNTALAISQKSRPTLKNQTPLTTRYKRIAQRRWIATAKLQPAVGGLNGKSSESALLGEAFIAKQQIE